MKKLKITLGHLYSDLMNTYGDNGNIAVLVKRCAWRGIECEVKSISLGTTLKPDTIDLYFFGGGQDQAQEVIAKDLTSKANVLTQDIERGVPLLAICGGYQLLGEYYQPHEGDKLMGLNIFPAFTKASHDRMIGNLVIETDLFGSLVGFENHSGKTHLQEGSQALGRVLKGFGNNGEDNTEGSLYKHAVGCYMHGSLLPKNPKLADWLIEQALETKYGEKIALEPLNDELEKAAHQAAIDKFS